MAQLWPQHHARGALPLQLVAPDLDGLERVVSEQEEHGQQAQAFGESGYVWSWGQATFENWQSEFLQLFTFVVLTTYLVHRKSHESPDTDYETEAALRRIEAQLKELTEHRSKP